MFERLPSSRVLHADPRGTVLAAFSFFLHATVAGTLLISSYLALPEVSIPRLRPVLVTPVLFDLPLTGAPALPRGHRPSLPPRKASAPEPPSPQRTQPPAAELPPPAAPEPEAVRADSADIPDSGSVAGSPDGLTDGVPEGKEGGVCVGENCDPGGPPGAGPGVRGIPGGGSGPAIQRPGFLDVTEPVLIESSKVVPRYPELARRAGLAGRVILEAVVQPDGTVASARVLRETPAGVGFAEAAIEAVSRWRYRPALQRGVPVAVYFTVVVDFELSR